MSRLAENGRNTRVIIYGAGAIGSIIGGGLARAGKDVILIGRPGHVNAIREHGLRLVTPKGTYILQIPAVTTPKQIDFGPNDVIYLCVKSQDTDETLRELHAMVGDVPIFCSQNGVRNEETATKYFSRVYGVRAGVGGIFLTDGEVIAEHYPEHLGWPIMGRYPMGVDYLVEAVAANLRSAGFLVLVTPDIMAYKWGQLISNLGNAVSAITDQKGGEGENKRITEAARREGREILDQAGIHFILHEDVLRRWPLGATIHFGGSEYPGKGSTWQSLARPRSRQRGDTEVDFLNGEIMRLAERMGRKAPVNETLLRITLEMAANREQPGKYTPTELCRLVGLN